MTSTLDGVKGPSSSSSPPRPTVAGGFPVPHRPPSPPTQPPRPTVAGGFPVPPSPPSPPTQPPRPRPSGRGKKKLSIWQQLGQKFQKTRAGRAYNTFSNSIKTGRSLGKSIGRARALSKGASARTAVAAGRSGAAVGGAAAGAATAVGIVVVGLLALRNATARLTEEQLKSAEHLKDISAGHAQIFAQKEVHYFRRDLQTARATEGSTGRLMESDARRKDEEARLERTWTNIKNDFLTGLNNAFTPVTKLFADAVDELKLLMGEKDEAPAKTWIELAEPELRKIRDAAEAEAAHRLEILRRGRLRDPEGARQNVDDWMVREDPRV